MKGEIKMANFENLSKGSVHRGYSLEETKSLFGTDTPVLTLVSCQLEPKNKFVDGKPTDEVIANSVYVAMPENNLNPFVIKLPANFTDLNGCKFGDKVVFDNFETCKFSDFRYYFKAKGMKKA